MSPLSHLSRRRRRRACARRSGRWAGASTCGRNGPRSATGRWRRQQRRRRENRVDRYAWVQIVEPSRRRSQRRTDRPEQDVPLSVGCALVDHQAGRATAREDLARLHALFERFSWQLLQRPAACAGRGALLVSHTFQFDARDAACREAGGVLQSPISPQSGQGEPGPQVTGVPHTPQVSPSGTAVGGSTAPVPGCFEPSQRNR